MKISHYETKLLAYFLGVDEGKIDIEDYRLPAEDRDDGKQCNLNIKAANLFDLIIYSTIL